MHLLLFKIVDEKVNRNEPIYVVSTFETLEETSHIAYIEEKI